METPTTPRGLVANEAKRPGDVIALGVPEMLGIEVPTSLLSLDANGNVVLKLTSPIQDGKDEITELTFLRPTAADMGAMDEAKGEVGKSVRLLARICRLTPKLIEKLDGYDYVQAGAVLAGFLSRPR